MLPTMIKAAKIYSSIPVPVNITDETNKRREELVRPIFEVESQSLRCYNKFFEANRDVIFCSVVMGVTRNHMAESVELGIEGSGLSL